MHDLVLVHILHALTDLPHEEDTVPLGQSEIVGHYPLEQLPARDAEEEENSRGDYAVMYGIQGANRRYCRTDLNRYTYYSVTMTVSRGLS